MNRDNKLWKKIIYMMSERLKESSNWFPLPCLISFGLIILFTGQILLGLNPRLGNPSKIITYQGSKSFEGSIWISMSMKNGSVLITTYDRKVFSWKEDVENLDEINSFIQYLNEKIKNIAYTTSLSKKSFLNESTVTIAIDNNIQFMHFKPLLYAFAKTGISDYAFEVKNPLQ